METTNNGEVYYDHRAQAPFVTGETADFWLPVDDEGPDFDIRPKSIGFKGCEHVGTFEDIFSGGNRDW